MNVYINAAIGQVVYYSNLTLMPIMCAVFLLGIFFRLVVYFTVKCEYGFSMEFEKRVHKYLADRKQDHDAPSFHQIVKKILEVTFHEVYELKRKYRRRRFDHVTSVTDRLFLIQEGAARLIRDALSQTVYLRKGGQDPKFLDISKFVFSSNPVFNRVFGIIPMGVSNDITNLLPGLFVVGGIFGTFIGVMQALPSLKEMDMANIEATKATMDLFLLNMSYSMGTSIVGIVFSVIMTILNGILSPESIYVNMVNKFTSSLEFLWNDTTNNDAATLDFKPDRRRVSFANVPGSEDPHHDPERIQAEVRAIHSPDPTDDLPKVDEVSPKKKVS
jgi:hypothetical protein